MDAVLTLERRNLLRQAALERRNLLSKAEVYLWSQQIQARALALDCYRTADAIAIYSPIQNEVDTGRLLDHALASGKRVFLPRWSGQEFGFAPDRFKVRAGGGAFGHSWNRSAPRAWLMRIDKICWSLCRVLFSTPAAIGWDVARVIMTGCLRNSMGLRAIAGLAYEFQIVEAVPAQEWDCGMHFIVTEERTIDCGLNLRLARAGSMGN